ncbi:PKD domain-containing protein [Desulfobacterales bacterium HSG2]|nr:PKD domain-containing protein [Desulfobacterales bacterium HSG2]
MTRFNYHRLVFCVFCLFLMIMVPACGGGDDSATEDVPGMGTGAVVFQLNWMDGQRARQGFNCAGIAEVTVQIYNNNNEPLLDEPSVWPCEAHEGTLERVPAGTDRMIVVSGLNDSGNTVFQGERGDVTVTIGETYDAGVIDMKQVVSFPDINLDAAIRKAIGKSERNIYASDLDGLTYLDASQREIKNLEGLQHLSDLTSLWLNENMISNISVLAELINLTELNLSNNYWLSDISPLIDNSGIGSGDEIFLNDTPLSDTSCGVYIPELESSGVTVYHNCSDSKPPIASITRPSDGATFIQGQEITFSGSAIDPEDGTDISLEWMISIGKDQISVTGESFTKDNLEPGTYTAELTATDSDGLTGTDSVIFTVASDSNPPTAVIIRPSDGATFIQTREIIFSGSATDPEDGTDIFIEWTISKDGYPVDSDRGISFTRDNLESGRYTAELTVTDSDGLTGTDSVAFTVAPGLNPPTATIIRPSEGEAFIQCQRIIFSGSAYDSEDGELIGDSLEWTLSVKGDSFDSVKGDSFTRDNLAPGTYTAVLTATDNDGLTGTDLVTFTVDYGANPPTAFIIRPSEGETFIQGQKITFSGSATDPEDCTDMFLAWTISKDGYPVDSDRGTSFTRDNLESGRYTAELTATDSEGLTGTDSVIFTVAPGPNPPTATIFRPSEGEAFIQGQKITFSGSAYDFEDGQLTGDSLEWTLGMDGEFFESVTGDTFTKENLSPGTYKAVLTATDNDGLTGTDSVIFTVASDSNPPTAVIIRPSDGATFIQTREIIFSGSATDPEDGTDIFIEWTISKDGYPVDSDRGTSFTRDNLESGRYTAELTATDSEGLTGTDSVIFTVAPGPIERKEISFGDDMTITGIVGEGNAEG